MKINPIIYKGLLLGVLFCLFTSYSSDESWNSYNGPKEYSAALNDCNCQKIIKNGNVVNQCQILQVSSDNTTQIGLGAGSINEKHYISITIRFKDQALEIYKNDVLSLWLEDGNMVDIQYFNGGLSYMGNSQVAQGIFIINAEQESHLKRSNIKTIAFRLSDGLRLSYQIKFNSDIIFESLKCLN